MKNTLDVTTTVLPGNKVEVSTPDLKEGVVVRVIVIAKEETDVPHISMLDLIKTLPPGPRSGETWDEIEREFQRERDSWNR